MYGDPGTVTYFDNVEMYEVDADPIAPTDKCKLFVNETTEPKVIDFKGMSYTGLDGTPITESVTLQPFSSKILVKSDGNSDVPDTTKPIVTSFVIPTESSSLTVPINAFSASDNTGVTGYLLTETLTVPSSTNDNWTSSAPNS